MAFANLLNNLCTWTRDEYDPDDTDEFNESDEDPVVMAENVKCRLEKLYDRELVEAFAGGDHDKGIYVLYLPIGQNIRTGDVVTLAETVKLGGFGTTTVDGLYKRTASSLNSKPIYEHTTENYSISYDGSKWLIKNTDTDSTLYQSQNEELGTKLWTVVDGTLPVGKSAFYQVADFYYNNDKPNEVIINDVEDAGGGQKHHLQCFCRYREEID